MSTFLMFFLLPIAEIRGTLNSCRHFEPAARSRPMDTILDSTGGLIHGGSTSGWVSCILPCFSLALGVTIAIGDFIGLPPKKGISLSTSTAFDSKRGVVSFQSIPLVAHGVGDFNTLYRLLSKNIFLLAHGVGDSDGDFVLNRKSFPLNTQCGRFQHN